MGVCTRKWRSATPVIAGTPVPKSTTVTNTDRRVGEAIVFQK
jgi:hypothetical protein